jgi:hypothetical protein
MQSGITRSRCGTMYYVVRDYCEDDGDAARRGRAEDARGVTGKIS